MSDASETTLSDDELAPLLAGLADGQERFASAFPGAPRARQPVHVVYGGAHRFRAGTATKLGQLALAAFDRDAPDGAALADALEWTGASRGRADEIRARVAAKLRDEPVEDFRIDFEDGYGHRPDVEEDSDAVRAAGELARALTEGTLARGSGIRIKALGGGTHRRSLRTLDRFCSSLLDATGGALPDGFVVTLPKVEFPEQARVASEVLSMLEERLGLEQHAIALELMVETPQAIVDVDGRIALPGLAAAAGARCRGFHFGTYDYTALLGVTAAHQGMGHPASGFALDVMQVSLAQRGYELSDGATTRMPIGPHRGDSLTDAERAENRAVVWDAWRASHHDIRRSLRRGIVQGWDLHPAQLPIRYATVYDDVLDGFDAAAARLRAFVQEAGQAMRSGDVFDDAATGQGLLNTIVRALDCRAVDEADVAVTGLTPDELRGRSFAGIVEARRPG